ncbi:hypothetical protein DFH09DRAFT_1104917 [Mycena vulgaris]|nr:hypothetical protein DFH09DRAFT_1104917 [Mycena vulgaris]
MGHPMLSTVLPWDVPKLLYGTSHAGSKSSLGYPTGPFVIHEAVHWGFHAMGKWVHWGGFFFFEQTAIRVLWPMLEYCNTGSQAHARIAKYGYIGLHLNSEIQIHRPTLKYCNTGTQAHAQIAKYRPVLAAQIAKYRQPTFLFFYFFFPDVPGIFYPKWDVPPILAHGFQSQAFTGQFAGQFPGIYIKFAIIYCWLWEFILHFAQQPGALLPNHIYHQLPFLATTPLAQKGNFTVFPLPGSEFDYFGCSNWPGVMFDTIKSKLEHTQKH